MIAARSRGTIVQQRNLGAGRNLKDTVVGLCWLRKLGGGSATDLSRIIVISTIRASSGVGATV